MEEIRKDVLNLKDIAYMMDPSVLKLDSCLEDVEAMIADCRKYSFGTCFAWPCYYERMYELLKGADRRVAGVPVRSGIDLYQAGSGRTLYEV